MKGLAKVSSSINLGNSGGLASLSRASISGQPSGRLTHYSHSLSSLRKPSIGAPELGSGSGLGAPSSNFYIARGETRQVPFQTFSVELK